MPVKSLMRFRRVSKPWRALIAHPFFVNKHLTYSENGIGCKSSPRILFTMNQVPQSVDSEALKDLDECGVDAQLAIQKHDFPVSFPDCSELRYVILGSSNGLVCVFVVGHGIVLWNPCTGESNRLPNPHVNFKPQTSHLFEFYGFVYDSINDDYKLVAADSVTETDIKEDFLIHHFSLKMGSWRTVPLPNLNGGVLVGQFLNGALHWHDHGLEKSRILSYNLAEEKFAEMIPLPPPNDVSFYDILIFSNCLCAFHLVNGPDFSSVWMMKEFGVKESWTQVIRFSLNKSPQDYMFPMYILEDGAILIHRVGLGNPVSIFMVPINENRVRTVCEADLRYGTTMFKETLVSPGTPSIAHIE